MKKLLLFAALLASVVSQAQLEKKEELKTSKPIIIGTVDTIRSKILNEKLEISVYVPNGYLNSLSQQNRYPVVYLLDGPGHFNYVVGMIEQLSQVNGNTVCPEMIVVGILNNNRARDLTPSKASYDTTSTNQTATSNATQVGGTAFISFMEKELMPFIDARYPTQPYKVLIGHSLGGLAVMNTLINHPNLFNSYVAVDPSMWWDDNKFLEASKKKLVYKDFSRATLYVGIANTMDSDMTLKKLKKDSSADTRHIRAIFKMDDFIKKHKPKGLRYASKYYEHDTHGSVPLIATYDAIRYIFSDYQLKVDNKDKNDSTIALADKFEQRYQRISKLYGYEVKPPEAEISRMALGFLKRKHFRKSEGFFKLNIENYPDSFSVYDLYGDFFITINDKEQAIQQFRKALSIKENEVTRNKLNKLLN